MKMRSVVVAVVSAALSFPLVAGEFTLKSAPQSLADWQNASFYDNGGGVPGAGDTVILPDNMTVKVDDESIAFVGSFAQIKPMGKRGSVLAVDIANDHDFGCAFYYAARQNNNDTNSYGTLVKTGAGCLSLANTTIASAYFTDMDIQAGAIRLPCKADAGFTSVVGRVNVGPAGLLMPSANTIDKTTASQMISLSGSGIVSNGIGTAAQCRFQPWFGDGFPTEFSGKIVGNITYYGNGFLQLTGTESTFTGDFHPYYNRESSTYGIVGVAKFGNAGEPSSIGSGQLILGEVGARILYLGSGETTAKNITFGDNTEGNGYATIMDAGANGGLTMSGQWIPRANYKHQRLVLTGSNTTDCVISGDIALNGTTRTYVTKKGTGTWNLADCARTGISGIAVDEGTLKFGTLYEQSVTSSLGDGKVKSEDSRKDVMPVAYDFRLGTATTSGTLDHTGAKEAYTSTRPLVLAGDGVFRNSGTNFYFHGGVSSIVSTPTTLTLDGDSSFDSVVSSVSNGAGVVSLAKTGAGTWILDGTNNTFTGGIDVKGGKLVLRGLGGFSWFRWTIREAQRPADGSYSVGSIAEFALFDKDDMRVGLGIVQRASGVGSLSVKPVDYRKKVLPGQMSLGRDVGMINNWTGTPDQSRMNSLCDGVGADPFGLQLMTNAVGGGWATCKPRVDYPNTWVPIMFRLADGEKDAVTYDWATWGGNVAGNPKSYTLEGSFDGIVWYLLDDEPNGWYPRDQNNNWYWSYNRGVSKSTEGVNMGTPGSPHRNGRAFTCITNLPPIVYANTVSVAPNATLEAKGKVQLKNLKVDANGAGTIKGFSFAEEGSVDVVNYNKTTVLGLTFEDCTGTENFANWSVKCDGKDKPSKSLSFKNGVLTVESSGLTVIVR